MKKILYLVLAIAVVLSLATSLASCGDDDNSSSSKSTQTTKASTATTTNSTSNGASTTSALSSTSASASSSGSVASTSGSASATGSEATVSADGSKEVRLWEDSGDTIAVSALSGPLAAKFTVPSGSKMKSLVFFSVPTWTETESCCDIRIFKWNRDYITSVTGDPIFRKEYTNHIDNDPITIDCVSEMDGELESGEYIYVFSRSKGSIGLWAKAPASDVEYFVSGASSTAYGFFANMILLDA